MGVNSRDRLLFDLLFEHYCLFLRAAALTHRGECGMHLETREHLVSHSRDLFYGREITSESRMGTLSSVSSVSAYLIKHAAADASPAEAGNREHLRFIACPLAAPIRRV